MAFIEEICLNLSHVRSLAKERSNQKSTVIKHSFEQQKTYSIAIVLRGVGAFLIQT